MFKIISSLPPVRVEIPSNSPPSITVNTRELVNGTIYVRQKPLTYDEYLKRMPCVDDYKLDALREAGIMPQMVNPVILTPSSSEFSQVNKDDFLQSEMERIEDVLSASSASSSSPVEDTLPTPTINE